MKTLFIITGLFILFFGLSCVKQEIPVDRTNLHDDEIILGYDYPIKPGTEEWKRLSNSAEKIEVCQIPASILTKLTTEELVNTCLRYPPLQNIYAFNNIQRGVEKLIQDFNGIRELLNRKDAYEETLKVYSKKINNSSVLLEKTASIKKGSYIITLSSIEMILCQIELRTHPNVEIQKTVMKELLKGYNLKLNNNEEFRGFGFTTNLLSRASIVLKKNTPLMSNTPSDIKIDANMINRIDLESQNLVNK
ncbi:hypothetical protein [Arcticibacter tournemirensis]|uniref:Lipoprotein n=1 Tax=Arcticibacter tournemirensis TaxID=699437 RepID=A0A4Q0MA91_9SPHI|nr:hypothetical protein [Arcticibacter tournemirensis]RXF70151.1 hypothetical protein EKH83_09735 [Arcticibacter tournemirensis]